MLKQYPIDFETHDRENNPVSQAYLEENKERFKGQVKDLYRLLMAGVELTRQSAINEYHIGDLAARKRDLKKCENEAGNKVAYHDDKKKYGLQVVYMTELDRKFNKEKFGTI